MSELTQSMSWANRPHIVARSSLGIAWRRVGVPGCECLSTHWTHFQAGQHKGAPGDGLVCLDVSAPPSAGRISRRASAYLATGWSAWTSGEAHFQAGLFVCAPGTWQHRELDKALYWGQIRCYVALDRVLCRARYGIIYG